MEALRELLPEAPGLPTQALAYIPRYRAISCVIPGSRSTTQLAANCGAAVSVLTEELKSRVEALSDEITDTGNRLLPW